MLIICFFCKLTYMYPTHLWTMSIFPLYPPVDNRKNTSGFLGFLLRKRWVGAFARNGSITNMVDGMTIQTDLHVSCGCMWILLEHLLWRFLHFTHCQPVNRVCLQYSFFVSSSFCKFTDKSVSINQFVLQTFRLCFAFTGINFRDMLHHVCDVAYDENMCGPVRARKCRKTN